MHEVAREFLIEVVRMKRFLLLASLLTTSTLYAQEKPSAGLKTRDTVPVPSASKVNPVNAEKSAEQRLQLPTGAAVKMRLVEAISTDGNKAGDSFSGRVSEPVMLDGKTVIPVGATIEGRLARVSSPRRIKGRPEISLHPESVTFPDGNTLNMSAVIVDSNMDGTSVNDEGQIKGSGHTRGDLIEMGAGAGGGLTIGALAGGGKGALIGAAIGGGAAMAHWLTKHHSTELPAGTELVMEISSPMTLSAGGGAGR
jgi:hypothetical protein